MKQWLRYWLCQFGFHGCTPWGPEFNFGHNTFQKRKCVFCGIIKERQTGHINDQG